LKKVGFLGGSFDPIHLGHIHLAISMLEKHQLDEIIFSPAFCSPHKENTPPKASSEHRLKMVELATSKIPGFLVDDFEVQSQKISYTIDAITHFLDKRSRENLDLFLIVASDTALNLHRWKSIEEVLQLASPLIGVPTGGKLSISGSWSSNCKSSIEKGITEIASMDIKSTEIRERLKKKLYCGHMLDAKVLDYISDYQLYS